MIRLALITVLCIAAPVGRSTVFNAANTTIGATSNALALCAPCGDTVQMAVGTASWTNGLFVTNGVIILGAGRGVTIISNAIPDITPGANYQHAFYFNLLSHTCTSYFGNLTITADPSQPDPLFSAGVMVEGDNKDGRRMAITNVHFYGVHGNALRIESALGVVARSQFDEPSGGIGIYGYHRTWNGYQKGHGSWSTNVPAGSDQMWYIEDCGFNFLPTGFTYTTIDGYSGWRYCLRYSNLTNQTGEGHGWESGEDRGTRYVEGYMNHFYNTNGGQIAFYLRSGEQTYFSNTMHGLSGVAPFHLLVDRPFDEISVLGAANGRNPFDSNTTAVVTGTASSAGTLTMTDSGKSWGTDQYVGYVVRRTTGINVTSMIRSGGTITADTSGAHALGNGFNVSICGATQIGYNGLYRDYAPHDLVSAVDSDTLTLTTIYTPSSPASGTIYLVTNNPSAVISANTGTQLTLYDSGYGQPVRCVFHAGDGYEISKLTHVADQPGAGVSTAISSSPPDPTGWSQGLAMCYEWGNTNTSGTAVHFAPQVPQIVVGGVHWTNAVKAGYTPYTYPHPLLTGEVGGDNPSGPGNSGLKIRARVKR